MSCFASDCVKYDMVGTTSTEPVYIVKEIDEIKDDMIANRRWFHQHPETAFNEVVTAAKIVEILKSYGITEIYEKIDDQTGVIAVIRGAHPGKCIGLRADIDALPLTETADIPYKSQNEGAMHACGHDAHMSGLLGTARVMMKPENLAQMHGSIKLIFQPAEEKYGGALGMIKAGCLEDGPFGPKVDQVYGIHIWSFGKVGEIQCSDGPVMAATDSFEIEVKGVGGHGAVPHKSIDAIVTAAHLVTNMQTIVSRSVDPLESGVITCGTINGGYTHNIIADKVVICGTARSFTPHVRDTIKTRMSNMCCGMEQCYGGSIGINYKYGYPATVNNYPECTALVRKCAAPVVGAARSGLPQKTMGAEDFSYFLEERPGCFFFVGAGLPGDIRPHHKSVFDIDENGILIGASVFVNIIRSILFQP